MAATVETKANGPKNTMYSMKPLVHIGKVELPDVMYSLKPVNGPFSTGEAVSDVGPVGRLEQRQQEVLDKLDSLKASVNQLVQRYHIPASAMSTPVPSASTPVPSASSSSSHAPPNNSLTSGVVRDLVVSADPSSPPLSLLVLARLLQDQVSLHQSTFVHSSLGQPVAESLRHALSSASGGHTRSQCQLAISLVWKAGTNGPQLMVDPSRQTAIQGEANLARYLGRLLQPAYDQTGDIAAATQTDDFLDLAQMQLVEGNAKERAAGVRALNAALGKKTWLDGPAPGLADFVCWSVLHQTGQAGTAASGNVKRWLSECRGHPAFVPALPLVDYLYSG